MGDRGEHLAAERLLRDGWEILHRGYRFGRKEIDLVARRGEVVAFVEVKTRRGDAFGHPLEAITQRKQREIGEVASAWIASHGRPSDVYRFDAVAVTFTPAGDPVVEHLEDAWGI